MKVEKRREILFCYDITDANPNGDPMDGNKPRIDEETGINIVTDVRLKRTIRDYLFNYEGYTGQNGKDIFVREIEYKDDKKEGIQDAKARAKDFKNNSDEIIKNCIDIRLFGGVIPLDKDSITYTGPVQFKMGRSIHPVELKHIKGTGAFASKAGKAQATFRDEYILPYSFIVFHGIINENAGLKTKLSEEDVSLLYKGIWNGTKNLISRTKFGQQPRLLIVITYKKGEYFLGDLDKKISISGIENPLRVRSVHDFKLNIKNLINITKNSNIEKIEYKMSKDLSIEQDIPKEWSILQI